MKTNSQTYSRMQAAKTCGCPDGARTVLAQMNAALCRSLRGEFNIYWR